MVYYRKNYLSKDDLATTLPVYKSDSDKGKREPREYKILFVVSFIKANGGIAV